MRIGRSGRTAVIALLLGVAAYVGLLLLFVEPTPWREFPEEGLSRNGVAYDTSIAELRIYRLPTRRYPFYFEDEMEPVTPLLRAGDPMTIERVLSLLQPPQAGAAPPCAPAKPESGLHVVTLRADGSVFGYVAVFEAEPAAGIAADGPDCATVRAAGIGGLSTWYVQGFYTGLEQLGVPR